ncbi:hypothetical protein BJY00DRAFT_1538 [Aspergillus carlsbadensis]|nr:hypothetical protein BJY00DRAFT_1538 [Aspergillus carlsbadensis]
MPSTMVPLICARLGGAQVPGIRVNVSIADGHPSLSRVDETSPLRACVVETGDGFESPEWMCLLGFETQFGKPNEALDTMATIAFLTTIQRHQTN